MSTAASQWTAKWKINLAQILPDIYYKNQLIYGGAI
jgi:hypothetical protein